jgi:uncharacterized protein (DUF2235 family)
MSRNLPFTTNNKLIKTFRHALALDECRAKFVPTFWTLSTPTPGNPNPTAQGSTDIRHSRRTEGSQNGAGSSGDQGKNNVKGKGGSSSQSQETSTPKKKKRWIFSSRHTSDSADDSDEDSDEFDSTDVKQVWFAGWHSGKLFPYAPSRTLAHRFPFQTLAEEPSPTKSPKT